MVKTLPVTLVLSNFWSYNNSWALSLNNNVLEHQDSLHPLEPLTELV